MKRALKFFMAYDCDEWKSVASMDATKPLIVTDNFVKLRVFLYERFPEQIKEIKQIWWDNYDSENTIIAKLNDILKNIYIMGVK